MSDARCFILFKGNCPTGYGIAGCSSCLYLFWSTFPIILGGSFFSSAILIGFCKKEAERRHVAFGVRHWSVENGMHWCALSFSFFGRGGGFEV